MRKLFALLLVLAAFAPVAAANAANETSYPTDTYVRIDNPNQVFTGDSETRTDRDAGLPGVPVNMRVFAQLPSGSLVQGTNTITQLQYCQYAETVFNPAGTFTVGYRDFGVVSSSFNIQSVYWNNQPTLGSIFVNEAFHKWNAAGYQCATWTGLSQNDFYALYGNFHNANGIYIQPNANWSQAVRWTSYNAGINPPYLSVDYS